MFKDSELHSSEIRHAFFENERSVRIQNFRVACILALIFMPAGVSLDYLVYPKYTFEFFVLRLICSALLFFIWWFVKTPVGSKHYHALGLILPALPSFFISVMIYRTEGPASPYYAGLNLVLLGAALVLRWTLRDSLFVFLEVLGVFLAACLFYEWQHSGLETTPGGIFFNNAYFLFVTGVFVVIGSYFYNRLRFREFALRFELDQNKQQLEESNRKLTELDQVKSRFFANISHELRTPLTLLLAPLEMLQQRYNRSFDDETRNVLLMMHANGMRLLKLINDLLDLVRLESGRMEVKREPVDIGDFIKGLASAARQMADDKRLQLQTIIAPEVGTVMVDRDKLEKVVLNLQFNSLKFTASGGKVELAAKRDGEQLVISVQDSGMGISEKNLPFVFDRFWQADDSSKRKYQGVGIGLSLVKELIEIQGGSVAVESEEGKGTKFTVRLPYIGVANAGRSEALPSNQPASKEDAAVVSNPGAGSVSSEEWLANLYRRAELFPAMTPLQETMRRVETESAGSRYSVLVADDEPDMLRFLKSQLARHYKVIEAVDGQQAIEKASQFLPDIILLDMMMPEKDGLQACRELRQRTPTQGIPIILLTARADEETKLSALSAGASDFLAKPFSTTELHVRIKNLVDSYHYQRKLAKQNLVLEETIEQLKDTETQLVQSEKLASLGKMSAGIIHEINNPLNYAATGLFTLRRKGKLLSEADQVEYTEIMNDVEEGIKRVKDIVSDLRTFTHPGTDQREQVDLSEATGFALKFLSNQWKDRVKVEQKLAENQSVWGNQSRLVQVLVNLLQNSLDALKGKEFAADTATICITGRVEAGRSILSVYDNGTGITPEHMSKIFDPFFTTKDIGEGMGLGLSICYRIVQDYEGHISVKTEPGRFCEFILDFPDKQPQTT